MKKLLIVESPAKIKTIQKFLGKEWVIMSTIGHIKDLPPKKLGITINDDDKSITLEYTTIEDKEKVISDICKQASTADDIYLAPDPDREGEIIAWHIGQEIEKVVKNKKKIHRITFNEITKPAITESVEHPGHIDENKVGAQQARRILDRWVGYEVSPILWKKVAQGTSAGRVQSVALRLVCEREEAIRAFKPEEYWSITGHFKHKRSTFEAALTHIGKKKAEVKNKEEADALVKSLKTAQYIIDSITDKKRLKNPLAPFMTSTLQQAAFNRLGFNVKKTMQLAQKLYEGMPLEDASTPIALISYMRTDSQRISETAIKQARDYIKSNFSKEYLPAKEQIYTKAKGGTQDAHEAVRPVDVNITPEMVHRYISKDAARLYELIWQRFVACQMQPAQYAQRQVVITGDTYTFKVTGSTLIFDGFLKVYGIDADEQEEKIVLPKTLVEKEEVDLTKIDPKQHFTQPPPKYSEASLVKEMEKEGIGRPSTYSATLSTIQERKYVTLDAKKRFTPTELGAAVTKILVENLPDIVDIKFTANMEQDLDKIANGDLERDKLLHSFYKTFQKDLKKFIGKDGAKKKQPIETNVLCPTCKKHNLSIRFGRAGEFLGCMGYPECTFTSNFKRNEAGEIELVEQEGPQELDEKCPQCGKPLRRLIGKYGPFISCSGYPDCKYIKQNKTNFPCPQCKGDIVERKWRGGRFWGCANYPKCNFAVFGEIEETPCPQCKLPFLVKKVSKAGAVTLMCHDKKCGYKKSE
jgi:DNA topoisomerase-1